MHGDGVHDDSGTIQQLIDAANAEGLHNITLPAGTFLLNNELHMYGSNITFSGQGDQTVLEVNNNFSGGADGNNGRAMTVMAQFGTTPLMINQAVTGNTIVFRGNAEVTAGQMLFLSNGKGSTALLEAAMGGQDIGPGAFNEMGPDEYVQIASVSHDANGNTIATLTQNVLGTDQYGNVAPNGVSSINYLHASTIATPADHVTVENFAIRFTDMWADSALYSIYTDNLVLNKIHVLNSSNAGGGGSIVTVGTTNALLENITSVANVGFNSTRNSTMINCTVLNADLEEACTDDLITQCTLTDTAMCDLRINDMACERNTFSYNTLHGGAWNTGAIAIAEGTDTTVENNTVHDGAASIWLGVTSGSKILNNVADSFTNYDPLGVTIVSGNSWQ